MMLLKQVVLLAVIYTASAHLCLLSPPQRGSISGLNKPASNDCILMKAPCGGRPDSHTGSIVYKAESNVTVIFQKNLDHYSAATPGYFSISFGMDDMTSTFKEVARIPDKGEPSLHLYSVNVTLPGREDHPHHILQVSYMTKNAKAPPAFYQCADMMLY